MGTEDRGPETGGQAGRAGWDRRDWLIVVVLSLVMLAALRWYWVTAPHRYSDTTMALFRAFEVDRSIERRVVYPRWAMDFNYTYGAPLLQYRPPLVPYLLTAFHWAGLGWIDSAKAVASLELLLSAIGMFIYARWLFDDRRAAFVAAGAYALAPYLLTNIQERGAISEAMALAILPWLAWAMHHCLLRLGRLWPWLSALLVALLMLAHNVVAFFSLPFLLLFLGLLAWKGRLWRGLLAVLGAMGLGLGLSAFYWAPALIERDAAQIAGNMLGPFEVWLASLPDWIQHRFVFDPWGSLRFRLALWQAVVLALALLMLALRPSRQTHRGATLSPSSELPSGASQNSLRSRRFTMALLAGGVAVAMLLQLDASLPVWQALPLAAFIQFPWRLLGIAAFCIAVLAGFVFTSVAGLRPQGARLRSFLSPPAARLRDLEGPWLSRAGWIGAVLLVGVVFYASTYRFMPRYYPFDSQISDSEISLSGLFERGREYFTIFSDFLPVDVQVFTEDLPRPRPEPDDHLLPMAGALPSVTVVSDHPNRMDLLVCAEEAFTLRFHRFYFPGWRVYAAGKALPTGPSGKHGLVTATLPAGEYAASVVFGETPVRSLARLLSAISLVAALAAGIAIRPARPILAGFAVAFAVVGGLLIARHGIGEAPRGPTSTPASFQDEIQLLGYHIPERVWRPGDDVPLTLYWLAQSTPAEDYTVFVHIVKPDDSAKVSQRDSGPILGYSPTTRWEPGELVVDEQPLHLDESTPPGVYLVVVGLYRADTMQNLPVSGAARVLPGDRVVLGQIEVVGH